MNYIVNLCGQSILIEFECNRRPSIIEEIGDYRSNKELFKKINKVLKKYGLERVKELRFKN